RYGSKDCGPGEMPDPELREDETRQRAFSFRKRSQQRRNPIVSRSFCRRAAESISWSIHGPIIVTWGSQARCWLPSVPRSFNQLPNNSVLSRQRSRVRVSSSPPLFPNIVVPFLRNAQGRLWALARLCTTRRELCSYTRQTTTKPPSSLNRNPGYPSRFLSVQTRCE